MLRNEQVARAVLSAMLRLEEATREPAVKRRRTEAVSETKAEGDDTVRGVLFMGGLGGDVWLVDKDENHAKLSQLRELLPPNKQSFANMYLAVLKSSMDKMLDDLRDNPSKQMMSVQVTKRDSALARAILSDRGYKVVQTKPFGQLVQLMFQPK